METPIPHRSCGTCVLTTWSRGDESTAVGYWCALIKQISSCVALDFKIAAPSMPTALNLHYPYWAPSKAVSLCSPNHSGVSSMVRAASRCSNVSQ